jgi:F-type H+-transporting ATPase subunit b
MTTKRGATKRASDMAAALRVRRWVARLGLALLAPALLTMTFVALPRAAWAEGMPQLDFKTPLTVSQVVWGAAIFVVLYVLLSRVGLPKVGAVIEQRAVHIAADLDAAKAQKAQADAAVAELTATMQRSRAEAQGEINHAVDQAKAAAAVQASALNARLEAQLKTAEARIGEARTAAMSALHQVASDTATTVIARLTGASPDPRRVDAAVAAALTARGQG